MATGKTPDEALAAVTGGWGAAWSDADEAALLADFRAEKHPRPQRPRPGR